MVKERDRKLGRLISTMSYNYPVLQVMGYRKMSKNNQVEVEPTTINIFDFKEKENSTPQKPAYVSSLNETAHMGQTLNKYKWNKDYLNDHATENIFDQ